MTNPLPAVAQKKGPPPLNILEVRSKLILRGITLAGFARRIGKDVGFVYRAITGTRRGPEALRIVERVKREMEL